MLNIEIWSRDEIHEFYTEIFVSAEVRISIKDLKLLFEYIGRLPVFAYELGDSAWRRAKILEIDKMR